MVTRSADLLRRARAEARLTQTELAARAGVAQPVISAYESGRREPSLPMLTKLVEATGHRMRIQLLPTRSTTACRTPGWSTSAAPSTRPAGHCCARGARNVRVFGSVARVRTRGQRHRCVGRLDAGVSLVGLAGLARELTELLNVPLTSSRDHAQTPDPGRGTRGGDRAVSRRNAERLEDILAAAEAITAHLKRGDITDGLVFDAVRVRLIEIGEAVAALDPALTHANRASRGSISRGCATTSPTATSIPPTRSSPTQ